MFWQWPPALKNKVSPALVCSHNTFFVNCAQKFKYQPSDFKVICQNRSRKYTILTETEIQTTDVFMSNKDYVKQQMSDIEGV